MHFKAYEFNQDKRDATSILTSTFRDPNEVTNADLANSFERASRARKEGFERMIKLVSATKTSGLSDTQLMMVLRSNGVTKKDARSTKQGVRPRLRYSTTLSCSTTQAADTVIMMGCRR